MRIFRIGFLWLLLFLCSGAWAQAEQWTVQKKITVADWLAFLKAHPAEDIFSGDLFLGTQLVRFGNPGAYRYEAGDWRLEAGGPEKNAMSDSIAFLSQNDVLQNDTLKNKNGFSFSPQPSASSPITFLSYNDAVQYCAWKNKNYSQSFSPQPLAFSLSSRSDVCDPALHSNHLVFELRSANFSCNAAGGEAELICSDLLEEIMGGLFAAGGLLNFNVHSENEEARAMTPHINNRSAEGLQLDNPDSIRPSEPVAHRVHFFGDLPITLDEEEKARKETIDFEKNARHFEKIEKAEGRPPLVKNIKNEDLAKRRRHLQDAEKRCGQYIEEYTEVLSSANQEGARIRNKYEKPSPEGFKELSCLAKKTFNEMVNIGYPFANTVKHYPELQTAFFVRHVALLEQKILVITPKMVATRIKGEPLSLFPPAQEAYNQLEKIILCLEAPEEKIIAHKKVEAVNTLEQENFKLQEPTTAIEEPGSDAAVAEKKAAIEELFTIAREMPKIVKGFQEVLQQYK